LEEKNTHIGKYLKLTSQTEIVLTYQFLMKSSTEDNT